MIENRKLILNLRVNGIKQREIYYEKVFEPSLQSVQYNAWVQLDIEKDDYIKAKIDAVQRVFDKANLNNDKEAKEKAGELLERLRSGA